MGDDSELQALISLIDEPDDTSFAKVKEQIFHIGTPAVPLLENAWENTFDVVIQQRIEDIIHKIQFNQLLFDLSKWAHAKDHDLMEGYILFTKYHYPSLKVDIIREELFQIKKDVWIEINENLTALEKIKVLNHILFEHHKFSIPDRRESEAKYLFLNTVLETKKGYSISIGILYTLLAQSLGMPVQGLLLPGDRYFMVWMEASADDAYRIKFCINPENHGGVFTKEELVVLLKRLKFPSSENFFIPLTPTALIDKMFELLSYLIVGDGDPLKQEEIMRLRDVCSDSRD